MVTRGADCVDPRPILADINGTVEQYQSSLLSTTITSPGGEKKSFATRATANMAFNDGDKELPDNENTTQTVTMSNVEPADSPTVFLPGKNVFDDHDILNSGLNSTVTFTEA